MAVSADESPVPDPEKRRTLKRIAAGAGGAATVAVGSTQAPRFSPIGRARAIVPFLAGAAVGATIGAAFMAGMTNAPERGTEEYDTLARLALWADGFRTFASNQATNETLDVTAADLSEFSVNRLMAEASLEAMNQQHDNGATQSEALAAGKSVIREQGATMEKNLLNETALQATEVKNFFDDAAVVSGLSPADVILASNGDALDEVSREQRKYEIELVNGEVWAKDLEVILYKWPMNTNGLAVHWMPQSVANEKGTSGAFTLDGVDHSTATYGGRDVNPISQHGSLNTAPWPQDEYESLDEQSKENIDPPKEPTASVPVVYEVYGNALSNVYTAISNAESEFETFLSNIWSDLQADDTDPSQFMTPTMLALTASEENTFPYATGALASMGVPTSAETVEVKFPNSTDENGDVLVETGQLFANPMPASGFQEGQLYDPANLTTNIYMAAHSVDKAGEQSYGIQQVDEPFEIITVWTFNENGEKVETDELTWGQSGFTGSETNYDDLIAALNDVSDVEQEAETIQREIVVDLEGGNETGITFPWDGDGGLLNWLMGIKLFGIPLWIPGAGLLGLGAYNRVKGD